jgi:hypothetical protein
MFWLAPVIAMAISVVYFKRSPKDQPLAQRLLVSAHGVVIAAIYLCALYVWWSGSSRESYGRPYAIAFMVPVALIAVSFWKFRGPRSTHLFQLANLFCIAASYFLGGMAITGDWL